MNGQPLYTLEEWKESAAHHPMRDLDVNQVFLLHRHWIWANYQRTRFDALCPQIAAPDDGPFLADEGWAAMYMWYALLWSTIEGFNERRIEFRGPMRTDIELVSDTLRRCRNVVFHVSSKDQNDSRLFALLAVPDVAATLARISTGLGRLFLEESARRKAAGEIGE